MATTYNIEIREFNGIDYDILYPKTTMENVDGLANSFSQIDDEIEGLSQDIDNLQRTKQDTATLKDLAFKDKATLTNGENVFGILPVNYGGTGLISSPSMLVNLGSANADNILKESPRPGVTGILSITNGGTGKSSASEAWTNLGGGSIGKLNSLSETDIPNLNAEKITTGTFSADRIPSLNASKITDGTFSSDRIPTLTISKISGVTSISQRPDYTISNTDLTAGSSSLATGKLYFYYE